MKTAWLVNGGPLNTKPQDFLKTQVSHSRLLINNALQGASRTITTTGSCPQHLLSLSVLEITMVNLLQH